jgi:hypothetical protein
LSHLSFEIADGVAMLAKKNPPLNRLGREADSVMFGFALPLWSTENTWMTPRPMPFRGR